MAKKKNVLLTPIRGLRAMLLKPRFVEEKPRVIMKIRLVLAVRVVIFIHI